MKIALFATTLGLFMSSMAVAQMPAQPGPAQPVPAQSVRAQSVRAQAVQAQAVQAQSTASASLTIRFEQLVAPTGQIMMSVFDNEAAHDGGGKPARTAMVKVDGTSAAITFTDLAPGRYAIKVLHDVDGDGQMKTNPFGMPLEPFAFSNGAKPEGGPARWQAASFDVPAGASETRISFK